ncbi:MAG: metallophosphoesterase [Fuerstiella sp.]|nr:metallophosphoesterase [Fuerstiella sp.]MCP4854955.1 metallophosphoesterase [Fuerstiella sp.]
MSDHSTSIDVRGLLFIGDPHLEARVPGFRKDDYPDVALQKFRWCLQYAREQQLQPILLGDLFQLPQDNPNWLLSAIIESIDEPLPAIYGNHDVRENSLKPNDSIHILFAGGHLKHVSAESPWTGTVVGRRVVVGGTTWGDRIPKEFTNDAGPADLVVWVTHHDIFIPGYEEAGRIRPGELPGIDLIVNGHIHRRLQPVSKGGTHWVTAGNITRRARSDASREHIPAVPCLIPASDVPADDASDAFAFEAQGGQRWQIQWKTVPHEPFDAVFHPDVESEESDEGRGSGFIADLRQLTARRTDSGAGLNEYLKQHLDQFEAPVAAEIMRLAAEVTSEDPDNHNRDL